MDTVAVPLILVKIIRMTAGTAPGLKHPAGPKRPSALRLAARAAAQLDDGGQWPTGVQTKLQLATAPTAGVEL